MKFSLLIFIIGLISCSTPEKKLSQNEEKAFHSLAKDNFQALPKSLINKKRYQHRIELGKKLYFEKALSRSGTISCNSCHGLKSFGVDGEKTSPGHDGTRGGRNSPTVYNAALNFRQFWDGRAKNLKEQALGPLLNPIEHGLKDSKEVVSILKNKNGYLESFKKAFPTYKYPITFNNVGRAISAFEKTLLTPSRFDDYLKGDWSALSNMEKRGMKKFVEIGCIGCHDGAGVGGTTYQLLGAVEPFPTKDQGRYEVTKNNDDKYFFKVPLLRNITETGPYFHDGSISDLEDVIKIMAKHQLGVKITEQDTEEIEAFLTSLKAKELPKL